MSEYADAQTGRTVKDLIRWAKIGVSALMVVALIAAGLLWLGRAIDSHKAGVARHDQQRLVDMHQQGFVGYSNDMLYTGRYDVNYFIYPVGAPTGSCEMKIYVDSFSGRYHAYIWLQGVESTRLYVTYDKLEKLPQAQACFDG